MDSKTLVPWHDINVLFISTDQGEESHTHTKKKKVSKFAKIFRQGHVLHVLGVRGEILQNYRLSFGTEIFVNLGSRMTNW